MQRVKDNLNNIDQLIGKRVHFISDCTLFPINEICKVLGTVIGNNGEILIKVRVIRNNKVIKLGSNMSNLMYQVQ